MAKSIHIGLVEESVSNMAADRVGFAAAIVSSHKPGRCVCGQKAQGTSALITHSSVDGKEPNECRCYKYPKDGCQ